MLFQDTITIYGMLIPSLVVNNIPKSHMNTYRKQETESGFPNLEDTVKSPT